MSSEALDGYARMIEGRGGELVRSLIGLMSANMNSKPKTSGNGNGDGDAKEGGGEIEVDMSEWISYFSFDFMGDMAYVLSFLFLSSARVPLHPDEELSQIRRRFRYDEEPR